MSDDQPERHQRRGLVKVLELRRQPRAVRESPRHREPSRDRDREQNQGDDPERGAGKRKHLMCRIAHGHAAPGSMAWPLR